VDVEELGPDPIAAFGRWLDDAIAANVPEPTAMALATVADAGAQPMGRFVLLKGFDERGFCWFTNYESAKGMQLEETPRACLVFPWFAMYRQVVVAGDVTRVDANESDDYFASRDRESQIGAWASPQSQVVPDRAWLEQRVAELEAEYDGRDVPRPPHWGGYRLTPHTIDFWHSRIGRLHDRIRYRRTTDGWTSVRLAP
jgi:pyridoxamine 5'-phosphate oxidase